MCCVALPWWTSQSTIKILQRESGTERSLSVILPWNTTELCSNTLPPPTQTGNELIELPPACPEPTHNSSSAMLFFHTLLVIFHNSATYRCSPCFSMATWAATATLLKIEKPMQQLASAWWPGGLWGCEGVRGCVCDNIKIVNSYQLSPQKTRPY